MTERHPAKRPPGRPTDAALGPAIVLAARDILAESGYGGLTTAAVAKRAGVSTATLYRRWPTKQALVIAAARQLAASHGADDGGIGAQGVGGAGGSQNSVSTGGLQGPAGAGGAPDTGSLRGDLAALLAHKNRVLAGATGAALVALLGEARLDPELDALLRDELYEATREHLEEIRERARARGEDITALDSQSAARLILGALIAGITLSGPGPTSSRDPNRSPLSQAEIALLLRALAAEAP